MQNSKIDWTRFFRPVCVLCMVLGGLWFLRLFTQPPADVIGLIAYVAGGLFLLTGGFFGLLGRPRALVPLLDFLALAASMLALWKVGLGWREFAGVALSALYLVSCNASTIIGDGEGAPAPDYSELHVWWENMENMKKQMEEAAAKKAEEPPAEPK